MKRASQGRAVCFRCRQVQAAEDLGGRYPCPGCGHLRIVSTEAVVPDDEALDRLFRLARDSGYCQRVDLPGLVPAPRRRRTSRIVVGGTTTSVEPVATEPGPPVWRAEPLVPQRAPARVREISLQAPPRPRVLDARWPHAQGRKWFQR